MNFGPVYRSGCVLLVRHRCVCICICICVYNVTHTHTYTHTHTHTHKHTHTHTTYTPSPPRGSRPEARAHTHTYIYTYTHFLGIEYRRVELCHELFWVSIDLVTSTSRDVRVLVPGTVPRLALARAASLFEEGVLSDCCRRCCT
jgi:hypothetical protein